MLSVVATNLFVRVKDVIYLSVLLPKLRVNLESLLHPGNLASGTVLHVVLTSLDDEWKIRFDKVVVVEGVVDEIVVLVAV